MSVVDRILGPRVPKEEREEHTERYRLPTWLFAGAALLLMVSLLLPVLGLATRCAPVSGRADDPGVRQSARR